MTGNTLLGSVERTSLRAQILDLLRGELMSGSMAAGTVHSAPALAARIGVSPSPVREAMLALVDDGLMQVVPNRGFRVLEVTEHDFHEIVELRRWLEIPGVGRAAETGIAQCAGELTALVDEIERSAAAGELSANLAADRQFHLRLLGATGNRRLVETVGRLRDQTRLYNIGHLAASGDLIDSAAEHRPLLQAVQRGDRAGAEALISAHLDHLRGDWIGQAPNRSTRSRDEPAVNDPGSR